MNERASTNGGMGFGRSTQEEKWVILNHGTSIENATHQLCFKCGKCVGRLDRKDHVFSHHLGAKGRCDTNPRTARLHEDVDVSNVRGIAKDEGGGFLIHCNVRWKPVDERLKLVLAPAPDVAAVANQPETDRARSTPTQISAKEDLLTTQPDASVASVMRSIYSEVDVDGAAPDMQTFSSDAYLDRGKEPQIKRTRSVASQTIPSDACLDSGKEPQIKRKRSVASQTTPSDACVDSEKEPQIKRTHSVAFIIRSERTSFPKIQRHSIYNEENL